MVHAVSHCGGDTGKRFDPICDIRCHIPVRFDHDQEIRGICFRDLLDVCADISERVYAFCYDPDKKNC